MYEAILNRLLTSDKSKMIVDVETLGLQASFCEALLAHASINFIGINSGKDLGSAWNGSQVDLRLLEKEAELGSLISNVCHEIGHYLVAEEEHRKLPDFGLGASFGSLIESDVIVEEDEETESRASLLGLLIEAFIGTDVIFSTSEHNWIDTSEIIPGNTVADYFDSYSGNFHHVSIVVQHLIDANLISNEGVPFICNGFEYSVNTL